MKKRLVEVVIGMILTMCCFLFTSLAVGKDLDYPTRPVNFIIPFGAGGTTDLTYRAFISAASKYLGQPIIPINKPGAGGTIAAMAVMTAKPDGYTIGGGPGSPAFAAPFSPDSPYKNLDGFTFIVNIGKYVYPMIVRDDAPSKSWKELIDWVRKNPGGVKIGLPGAKAVVLQGFVLSQVEEKEKVDFTYVSFKSSAEILTATLGGHITMYGSTMDATVMSYLKEGKLRLLAFSDAKAPGFESSPALRDLYDITTPNLKAIWGPKGLPDPVVKKLEEVFAKAVKDSEFVNIMNRFYMPVVYMDRIEVNKYVSKTMKELEEIVKRLRAKEKK
jgi:tripartite-type tricarboxylate transporter receptor subunit TctC